MLADATEVSVLGRGGMGTVYRACSQSHGVVAVKVMDAAADDGTFRARFAREIEAARSVRGTHVAAVLDADPDAERPWVAMEYIDGVTLADTVQRDGALPSADVLRLMADMAESLREIHSAGLVHRDLKPSNVMLASDGRIVVIDFGIASWSGATHLTATGQMVGTLGYLSPEQAAGKTVDGRSDVFSLGATAYFAATGTAPFGVDTWHETMARILGVSYDPAPLADGRVADLIALCLRRDPATRPDPADLADRCRAARTEAPRPVRPLDRAAAEAPTTLGEKASGADGKRGRRTIGAVLSSRRARWIVGAATAALLVAGGGVAWVRMRPAPYVPHVRVTAEPYPHGNVVTLDWDRPSTDSGRTGSLLVNGGAPPQGCPATVTAAGRCSFTGAYDATYSVSLKTDEDGKPTETPGPATMTTYPAPSLSVAPGPVVTDEATGQKGCKILLTARGLAPSVRYDTKLMTRYWETHGESAKAAKTVDATDGRGSLSGTVLMEASAQGASEWGYGQRDGWVTVTIDGLVATRQPWGCP